jgi:hypothetical protein
MWVEVSSSGNQIDGVKLRKSPTTSSDDYQWFLGHETSFFGCKTVQVGQPPRQDKAQGHKSVIGFVKVVHIRPEEAHWGYLNQLYYWDSSIWDLQPNIRQVRRQNQVVWWVPFCIDVNSGIRGSDDGPPEHVDRCSATLSDHLWSSLFPLRNKETGESYSWHYLQ